MLETVWFSQNIRMSSLNCIRNHRACGEITWEKSVEHFTMILKWQNNVYCFNLHDSEVTYLHLYRKNPWVTFFFCLSYVSLTHAFFTAHFNNTHAFECAFSVKCHVVAKKKNLMCVNIWQILLCIRLIIKPETIAFSQCENGFCKAAAWNDFLMNMFKWNRSN